PEIVEIVLRGIFAKVGPSNVGVAEVRHHTFDVLGAMMHHAESAAGELGIATALFLGRALKQRNTGALLGRSQSGTQRGVASADDSDIKRKAFHSRFSRASVVPIDGMIFHFLLFE